MGVGSEAFLAVTEAASRPVRGEVPMGQSVLNRSRAIAINFVETMSRGDPAEIAEQVAAVFAADARISGPTVMSSEPQGSHGWALRLRRLTGPLSVAGVQVTGDAVAIRVSEAHPLAGGLAQIVTVVDSASIRRWSYRPLHDRRPGPTSPSELLDELARAGLFAGVVLLRDHDGRRIMVRGWSDHEALLENTSRTRHSIASITKLLTATACFRLADLGRLRVDARLADLIPATARALGSLTPNDLLTHTAGLPSEAEDLEAGSGLWSDSPTRNLATWSRAIPIDRPGRYAYSNVGYAILGSIIESVTDRSYFEAMDDLVFRPFALSDTSFEDTTVGEVGRAIGLAYADDRDTLPTASSHAAGLGRGAPYGYAYSSVRDLERFLDALRGTSLLSSQAARALLQPAVPTDATGVAATAGAFVDLTGGRSLWHSRGAGPGTSAWASVNTRTTGQSHEAPVMIVLANRAMPAAERVATWLRSRDRAAADSPD